MKAINTILLILTCICVCHLGVYAQTDVSLTSMTKEMSKGKKPCYKLVIPENNLRDVKSAWEKLLKENSKGKMQTVNAQTSMMGAVTLLISAAPINIYSQMDESNGAVTIYAYFELPDSSFVSSAIADKDAGVKKYLHDFGTQLFKASVQKMADDEMKKLLDAEHQLDAKLRDEQRAKMEIIMLNCDIKRREEDNAFIVKEQAYNDQQIARQRDLIEKSKGKVDAITGKAKGRPEGVSAESQRVLDNLLKQKTSIEKEAQKNTLDGTLDRDKIKDQEKNIERALKDQVIQKAAVASQKLVVEKLLAKLATIK